jgi:hypothetical protein
MKTRCVLTVFLAAVAVIEAAQSDAPPSRFDDVPMTGGRLQSEDGYRGIWYYNQPTKDEYKFKYSGGFATYPVRRRDLLQEVDKTFSFTAERRRVVPETSRNCCTWSPITIWWRCASTPPVEQAHRGRA